MSKKVKESIETIYVDENGEIKSSEVRRTYKYPAEPNYIKLYLGEFLQNLNGLSASCTEIMYQLLNYVTYANDSSPMVIYINSKIKKEIMEHTNITSLQTIDNCLSQLVKQTILFRVYRGTYQLNPYIFGKGDWRDIYEVRLTYIFNENGKVVERTTRRFNDMSSLTEEQKEIAKKLEPLVTLAKSELQVNENLFDKLDELCKKLGKPPIPEWYKDFLKNRTL